VPLGSGAGAGCRGIRAEALRHPRHRRGAPAYFGGPPSAATAASSWASLPAAKSPNVSAAEWSVVIPTPSTCSYVFAGNRADRQTVTAVLANVRRRFTVRRVVWVYDRGMASERAVLRAVGIHQLTPPGECCGKQESEIQENQGL